MVRNEDENMAHTGKRQQMVGQRETTATFAGVRDAECGTEAAVD
jgi:hypothetical protein